MAYGRGMFNRSAYVSNLSSIPLFSACSKRELQDLARRAEHVQVTAGTELVKEGDRALEFFVIVSGEAKVVRKGRKIATLSAGAHFGELGLLADQRRTASVVALTDMDLVVLHTSGFSAAIADIDTLSRKLLAGLARQVIELDRKAYD